MKYLITTLLICVNVCFSQNNGKAFYVKTTTEAFNEKLDSLSKMAYSPLKKMDIAIQDLEFVLTFNKDMAVYNETKKMQVDNNGTALEIAKIIAGYSGLTYYDFNDKKIYLFKDFVDKQYIIKKNMLNYEWKITKDKIIINNLTCYKATTSIINEGRNGKSKIPITAWFTNDISISSGPDGFGGLPGLIIQLQKGNIITTLKKVMFSDDTYAIELPKNGKYITEEEFNILVKEVVQSREGYFKN